MNVRLNRKRLIALGVSAMTMAFSGLGLADEPCAKDSGNKAIRRPNIVIILADDLGAETLGCYGGAAYKGLGAVRTPNLDALARNGMRFTSCFSTPVCSPARSELLTGKYNFRTGFIDIAGRNGATERLDPQAHPTLAAQLKTVGYVTAVAGKWHLGPPESMKEIPATAESDTDYPHPRACGFDRQCIFGGAHLELYGKPTSDDYTPARLQGWVIRFLESRKGKTEPFFLYYPSPIPHDPLLPTPLNSEGSNGPKKRGDKGNFPYLIEYLDKQVGEVLKKLTEAGLRENTLVLFSGDNGTWRPITTEMRDGRSVSGGKGTLLDTGVWVPLLASWPGVIREGAVSKELVDFTDILPTCLELAGTASKQAIDGISFAPQLQGTSGKTREWVHSLQLDKYFVRNALWKLRENGALYDVSEAPYAETLVTPETDTPESKAVRVRLQAVMDTLHPR